MLKHLPEVLVLASLVLVSFAKDVWEQQWQLVAWALIVTGTFQFRQVYRLPMLVMGTWLMARALWGVSESWGLETKLWLTTSVLSLRQTAFLFLVVSVFTAGEMRVPKFLTWAVPLVAISTCFFYPLLSNESLNAALLVACLPFVSPTYIVAVGTVVTIAVAFTQQGTTAPVMLAAWAAMQLGRRGLPWVGAACAGYVVYRLAVSPFAFHESTRAAFYPLVRHFFESMPETWHWLGMGLGSFVAYGPIIQAQTGFMLGDRWWLSLHSDWLQLVFEQGYIGAVLGLWLYLDSLWRADRETRMALVLLGICGLGYFPMQVPIMTVFAVWCVVRVQLRRVA